MLWSSSPSRSDLVDGIATLMILPNNTNFKYLSNPCLSDIKVSFCLVRFWMYQVSRDAKNYLKRTDVKLGPQISTTFGCLKQPQGRFLREN